ncbi:uncharacterized protein LOC106143591 [Amyelois transitella]|uniref:uncharacterized protein LOC106143591 n=1 Tax=Amyelois transitella TaxID=680683 RepID=UPI00299044B4|nr:uncharacterized protein LOC106143591 [Amyelois transitella]
MWHTFVLFALFASAQGRAVNISNTWVLPEEGFPVFYRYFRDRISWYEADAVCQFHHANLVTVDTTAQYDAVRAYLKELDISSAVWVGLIRSNPDGDFTWTDYRGLSGDGYWSSAPDARAAPLCAAADPAADYRWEARACGGPTVASFICELPVPQWALGNEGCMVRALPALTVLYLPESAAVQLTADCGLAGVKRVQCTGSVKRENLLKELSCNEEEDVSSTSGVLSTTAIYSVVTTDAPASQETVSEITIDENATTEHEDDINQTNFIKSTSVPNVLKTLMQDNSLLRPSYKTQNKGIMNKNINVNIIHNNNLQSNEIPKIANIENFLNSQHLDKLEDEKNMQHKMLHDELARLGNVETIFTLPTDHFVPPLVMARSKLGDDMTVLSLEEKHAQQLAEQEKLKIHHEGYLNSYVKNNDYLKTTTENLRSITTSTDKPSLTTTQKIENKDVLKKDKPKKYNDKKFDIKNKVLKSDIKMIKPDKPTENTLIEHVTHTGATTEATMKVTPLLEKVDQNKSEEEPTIDLTVIIKNIDSNKNEYNFKGDVPKIEVIENDTTISDPEIKLVNTDNNNTGDPHQEISVKIPAQMQNFTFSHEVIKITIINEESSSVSPSVFEVTTKMPIFESEMITGETISTEKVFEKNIDPSFMTSTSPKDLFETTTKLPKNETDQLQDDITTPTITSQTNIETKSTSATLANEKDINTTESAYLTTSYLKLDKNAKEDKNTTTPVPNLTTKFTSDYTFIDSDEFEKNNTETSETIDDLNSPLLSGANEPIHRPNRSRRPQQTQSRINKFNPFRILG